MENEIISQVKDGSARGPSETFCGICLLILVAALAITGVAASGVSSKHVAALNEAARAYAWYESKSAKQTALESQYDLLRALRDGGALNAAQSPVAGSALDKLYYRISRLKREKSEILLGSRRVGEENWAQSVGGKLGAVTGAREWDSRARRLEDTGRTLDIAAILLLVGLLAGAALPSLMAPRLRWALLSAMLALGAAGGVAAAFGLVQAYSA